MNETTLEWDPKKAASNVLKHGVTFQEAIAVFSDPFARIHDDAGHSALEQREIIVGRPGPGRLLLVAFVERDNRVRIISARPATRAERDDFEEATRP